MANEILKWIKENYYVVLVCLISILACLYLSLDPSEQVKARDKQWIEYINQSDCLRQCLGIDQAITMEGVNFEFQINKT
jgi:hypothetical protein